MRRFPWIPLLALLLTVVLFRVATAWPLGLPGEWTWERIEWNDANRAEAIWGFCLAAIVGAVYAGFVFWGQQQIPRADAAATTRRRLSPLLWLCGLWIVANGWVLALQQAPPEPYNLIKATWVTYYPSTSGYFFHARYEVDDLAAFLAGYEDWMREGDVLHVGTHPPGLYLLNEGMLRACESSAALTNVLTATMPADIERGLDDLNGRLRGTPRELSTSDRAAIWGTILLTQAVALATIFPLYGLVRLHYPHIVAWQTVSLWPLVPAMVVFLPKSDTLYPFATMLLIWSALTAVRRRSWFFGLVAGVVLWLGLVMSLALLPGLVLALLLMGWESFVVPRGEADAARTPLRSIVAPAAAMVAAFALLVAATWWWADLNLLNCWRLNLANHAGFYDRYPRTYGKWLLVNPLELAVAFGLPAAFAVIGFYARIRMHLESIRKCWMEHKLLYSLHHYDTTNCVRSNFPDSHLDHLSRSAWGPLVCCPAVWVLLWLSGKNMGEAARLWIFLLPWGLWMLAPWLSIRCGDDRLRSGYVWLLVAQLLAAIVTVASVSGFHFRQF